MSLASRIFQGTVILGVLGTVTTEFLKSATSTVTSREIGDWYARTRALPAPAANPISNGRPATPRESIDEAGLIRLLTAGEFGEALASARATPALAPLVPGCELFVRFEALRDSGDFVSARRATRDLVHRFPRLASVAEAWNCRLARMQKGLPDDGQCQAEAGLGRPESREFTSPRRSKP